MEAEPVARRLRSRESGAAAVNESRRAFGDASNRAGKKDGKEPPVKRTKTTRASAAVVENRTEGAKTGRVRTTKSVEEAKQPTRRSSSRIKTSTADVSKSDKLANKNGGAKRSSKEAVETKTTRSVKRAKTEAAPAIKPKAKPEDSDNKKQLLLEQTKPKPKKPSSKSSAKPTRRSTRNSSDNSSSKPFVVPEVPIVQAPPRHLIPVDFGLTRDDSTEQDFTHGIAYYDVKGRDDTLLCKDYVTDMFQNMYEAEERTRPQPYMDSQEDINAKMRAILVDWLVEVHMKFRLNPNTLYLCVNIIDRYCSKVRVKRSKLQLVGVTALLVACKHEEIYPPEVRDCVYITDRAYTRSEVLDMEQSLLKELNWKISVPTAYPFLHRFLTLLNASDRVGHAAHYYLERSLQEHDMLDYRPSEISCAAVILAINNRDILIMDEDYDRVVPGVPEILLEYTGFEKKHLIDICEDLAGKVANECVTASKRRLTAVKKKFESSKYMRISTEADLPTAIHLSSSRA